MKKAASIFLGLLLVFSLALAQPVFSADGFGGGGGSGANETGAADGGGKGGVENGKGDGAGGGGAASQGAQDGQGKGGVENSIGGEPASGGFLEAVGSFFSGIVDLAVAAMPGGFAIQGGVTAMTGQTVGHGLTGYGSMVGRGIEGVVGAVTGALSGGGGGGGQGIGSASSGSELDRTEQMYTPGALAVSLTADRERVNRGESISLTWNARNADSCNASGDRWSGEKPIVGTEKEDNLEQNQVFTLTCSQGPIIKSKTVFIEVAGSDLSYETALNSGPGSQDYTPNSSSVSVGTVETINTSGSGGATVVKEGLPTVSLISSAKQVAYGKTVTLSWQTKNAIYCKSASDWPQPQGSIGQGSYKPVSGAQSIPFMTVDRVFTISCFNSLGDSTSSSVKVVVLPPTGATQ